MSNPALPPLTQIGRYKIDGELGRGAMGVVFKAFDPLVERTVAIKTIPLNVAGADLLLHRLQLEAKSVGQLEHPNIVTLYDAGEAQGVFYLAMQFIQGETLRDRMSRQRWFSLQEIQAFLRQICSALDYAHQRGVIHRDIKPSNIMITPEGVVKLTDFGVAKLAGGTTTAGLIMGTPSYMSPEQALGRPLDGRSDIFSLGSIFYELITGEQAFPGTNATTVMYRIVHEPPSPITALQPGFDPALESVIFKALAKPPEQRYQTCAELVVTLDCYVQGAASAIVAPPTASNALLASRPDPAAQSTASSVLNASRPDLATTASLSVVEPPNPRRSHLIWTSGAVLLTLLIVTGIWGIMRFRHESPQVPTPPTAAAATSTTNSPPPQDPASVPAQATPPADATSNNQPLSPPPATSPAASPVSLSPAPAKKPATKAPGTGHTQPNKAGSDRQECTNCSVFSEPKQDQPKTFEGQMLKGNQAFQLGHYDDALAAYSEAYRMQPTNPDVRHKIAFTLTLLGRSDEAQKYR